MEALFGKASSLVKASTMLTRWALPSVALRGLPRVSSKLHGAVQIRKFSSLQNVDTDFTKHTVGLVNGMIDRNEVGRLFAVIQVCGKQFKVTNNDIIVIQGYWPPNIGDELRMEKVLLLGSSEFTLVGRPLLPLDQVTIKATVVEKPMTHTKVRFKYIKRKQCRRLRMLREPLTYLRINSISLQGKVNELGDVDGTVDKIF